MTDSPEAAIDRLHQGVRSLSTAVKTLAPGDSVAELIDDYFHHLGQIERVEAERSQPTSAPESQGTSRVPETTQPNLQDP